MHCYACESSWLILILSGKSECCVWKGTSGEVLSYKGNGAIGCHQYGTLLAVSECDSGAEQLGAARVVQTAQLDASGHEDCSDIRRSTAESRSALHANATACVGGTRTTMSELMASSQALSRPAKNGNGVLSGKPCRTKEMSSGVMELSGQRKIAPRTGVRGG